MAHFSFLLIWTIGFLVLLSGGSYLAGGELPRGPEQPFQGEYEGTLMVEPDAEPIEVALQVAAYGNNSFRARLYQGSLPGDHSTNSNSGEVFDMEGTYADHVLELEGGGDLRFRYIFDRFTALDERNEYRGRLEPVRRESPTLNLEPPSTAIVLFDGSNIELWDDESSMTDDGLLKQGATTRAKYGDIYLHLEAMLDFIPFREGQQRANSGIYLQNRYEVQILDSFAQPPAIDGNGSLYKVAAPLVDASYPPLTWQTYDIHFRAPRFGEDGAKTENARVTVYLNGILVQDDVELESGTGAGGEKEEISRGELYLQDHNDPVRFRNIWLVEREYSPPPKGEFGRRQEERE